MNETEEVLVVVLPADDDTTYRIVSVAMTKVIEPFSFTEVVEVVVSRGRPASFVPIEGNRLRPSKEAEEGDAKRESNEASA